MIRAIALRLRGKHHDVHTVSGVARQARPPAGSPARLRPRGHRLQRRHRQHRRRPRRHEALGDHAVAVTADSPSVPRRELREAAPWRPASAFVTSSLVPKSSPTPITSATTAAAATSARASCTVAYRCCCRSWERRSFAVAPTSTTRAITGRVCGRPPNIAVRHPLQEAGFSKADVRALALHWESADLGQAGVAVPVESAGPRRRSHARADGPGRSRRGVPARPGVPRMSGTVARGRTGPHRGAGGGTGPAGRRGGARGAGAAASRSWVSVMSPSTWRVSAPATSTNCSAWSSRPALPAGGTHEYPRTRSPACVRHTTARRTGVG